MSIICSLPKDVSDHGNPIKVFEELGRTGTSSDIIAEIMGFFCSEDITIGGEDGNKKWNIPLHSHEEEDVEIDLERVDAFMKHLKNKKGTSIDSIHKDNIQRDDIVVLRFSRKKREGEDIATISFDIAFLVENVLGSTMTCLMYVDYPDKNEEALLKNISMRLPILPEGKRHIENLTEKIGHSLDEEKRSMLSEKYLRKIILIPRRGVGVMSLWNGIRENVGKILRK